MAKSKALKLDWKIAGAAAGILWCIYKIRKGVKGTSGIGSVDWHHAVWVAQNELGIDFDKSYFAQDQSKMYDLAKLGKRLGYRRSYDNGKSYGRAFYDALSRRAEKINAEISQYER